MSDYLDRYGRAKSVCHRLPPLLKLWLTLLIALTAVIVPVRFWPLHGMLVCTVFIGYALGRIPLMYVLRRLAVFVPMMLLLSVSMPLSQGFAAGWEIMFSILIGSSVSFLAGLWLVNVMPFGQLLATLSRLWIPDVLIALLAFMYRYIFVLWDELDKMRVARRARTFGKTSLWFRWKVSAQVIGMLLIRAMSRAERVHGAMCARGWDGRVRTLE